MRLLGLVLALLLAALSVPCHADYTQLWWNSSKSGMGVSIHQQGNTIVGAWFMYETSGQPSFLVFSGALTKDSSGRDSFTGDLFRSTGTPPASYDASRLSAASVGSVTITFNSAASARMSFAFSGQSGVLDLVPYVFSTETTSTRDKQGEWIVYALAPPRNPTHELGDPYQIFRMRPDGTQRLQLTDPANRSNEDPSFNGKTIVFSSSRAFFGSMVLYKMAIDGLVQTRVTANGDFCTEHQGHVSPDDRMIAFVMSCRTPGSSVYPLVYRINTDGSGQVRVASDHPALAAPHPEGCPAFTSSGTRIVFSAGFGFGSGTGEPPNPPQPLTSDLFVMDLDGRNTRRLTNWTTTGRTVAGCPSVSGDSVFFTTTQVSNPRNDPVLETMNVDGTGRRTLFALSYDPQFGLLDSRITPSPDGRFIVFVRADFANGKVVLMRANADNGSGATVLDSSGVASSPSWK